MRSWSKRLVVAAAGMAAVWSLGIALVEHATAQDKQKAAPAAQKGAPAASIAKQAAPVGAAKSTPSGTFYKNVTTSTLKELTPDDFLGAMGVMAAALGYDCADCHPSAGSDKVDWVFDTPKKKTARRMVEMVAAINKTHFGGLQAVTCYTCHHGRDLPSTSIALDQLYGPPSEEKRDVLAVGNGVPTADQIFDKYIQAVGGAQRLNALTSYTATGTSLGYEGLGGGGTVQIYAKSPNMRNTSITFKDHPERGLNARTTDGTTGWIRAPRGLFTEYELVGTELDGARLDAQLAFPGQIKTILRGWRVGNPDTIKDKDVYPVQGTGPRGLLATLYFERESGLLVRVVRFGTSPIGRVPTQTDYSDYRDAGGGVKLPFTYTFSWLDGRDSIKLSEVKTNAAIDAAKFGKP